MITADELSETAGVAGWGWYISISVVLIDAAFWPLENKELSLAPMTESITLHKMENYKYRGTFGSGSTVCGFLGYCGWGNKKKNSPERLCPPETLKYEASLWIYNIMSLALYYRVASGWVGQ